MPEDMQPQWIDSTTGYLTGEGCPGARLMPFVVGSEPRERTQCSAGSKTNTIRDWFQSLFGGNS